jgi:DNA-binding response OmpR family regulator
MPPKILLVEDDVTMLSLLRTLLRFDGYEAVGLERDDSVELILNSIRREKPAVILMDVNLRQINGFDLLQALRASDDISDSKVIMSSGTDFNQRCLDAGANAFILKPYMPDDLLVKIRQVLDSKPQLDS